MCKSTSLDEGDKAADYHSVLCMIEFRKRLTLGLVVFGFFSPAALGFCMGNRSMSRRLSSLKSAADYVCRCAETCGVLSSAAEVGDRSLTMRVCALD